jgi:hypothetical protein
MQLLITIPLAVVIIFVPYVIGLFTQHIGWVNNLNWVGKWFFGFMVLVLLTTAVSTLTLFGKGLWIFAGHILGNY